MSPRRYSRVTRSQPPFSNAVASARSDSASRAPTHGKIATAESHLARNSLPRRRIPNTAPRRWIGMFSGFSSEAFVRGQRQDQPAVIVEPVEPDLGRPGRAGVHVNHIGRIKLFVRAVA